MIGRDAGRRAPRVGAALLAVPAGADGVDRGGDRPPPALTDGGKTIWMTEWVAYWRLKLGRVVQLLHVRLSPATTPQQAADRLATRAVRYLYETQPELLTARDGCRAGILWRYYHPGA